MLGEQGKMKRDGKWQRCPPDCVILLDDVGLCFVVAVVVLALGSGLGCGCGLDLSGAVCVLYD